MLDINSVAVFVQTVKSGSFAAAGRRLDMPANTVSRRVQQLEEAMGVRLLQRSTRKLNLTGAGREFYDRSVAGIEDIEAAHQDLIESSREPRGTLRVAVSADFFEHFSVEAFAGFLASQPKLRLEFLLSDARVDLIEQGIDVAFRAGNLEDSSLVARKLREGRQLLLVATPGYVQARGRPDSVESLAGHDCVATPMRGGRTTWRLTGPEGDAEVRVSGHFAANTLHSHLRAVRAGLGIGLLPDVLVDEDLASGRLVRVLPEYRQVGGGFYAVYPSRRQLSRAVSALIDFVDKLMSSQIKTGCRSGG